MNFLGNRYFLVTDTDRFSALDLVCDTCSRDNDDESVTVQRFADYTNALAAIVAAAEKHEREQHAAPAESDGA